MRSIRDTALISGMPLALLLAGLLSLFCYPADAELPPDPLGSVQWEHMAKVMLSGHPVVFDERVRVQAPKAAENSKEVPLKVDASAIDGVQRILVFADLNPLPKIIEFEPREGARPTLAFRFKVQQSTPVHAAVLADDGRWHVGGVWVEAAGGGCTLPSLGSGEDDWTSHLGEVSAGLWPRPEGERLRFRVIHPMDTGLAPGIPTFHITEIHLLDEADRELGVIRPYEPVSEDPIFSLDLAMKGPVRLRGRDNNGNRFTALVVPR
jgi:sulfur-oxidizing protein SoxY